MSTHPVRNTDYGVREFDLSTARTNERIPVNADTLTVLRSQDTAEIRLGSPNASAIPTRDLGSIDIPDKIDQLYLSNSSGTGILRLLLGLEGVKAFAEASGDDVDVTDRAAREIGKARVQDSGGVLIDPATDGSTTADKREVTDWTATQTVTVQENNPLNVSAATVSVQEATPIAVDSLTNTLSREIATWTAGPIGRDMPTILTASTTATGSENAATVQIGEDRSAFDVAYDLSGAATVTIEVSSDGATWRTFKTVDVSAADAATLTEDSAFEHVRAYADANVNTIEISAKGV